jgi:hypothetical protein
MRRLPGFSIWGLSLVLSSLSLLYAQAPSTPAADPNAAANPALASQAPDEMTKKITDLVHAGKYSEAHQLTAGLLIAYPDDERLIKAKALIEKLLAPGSSASAAPVTNQPTQPTSNSNAEQLTGMDKVDYDALIELGRQAQQNTDLEQQKASLKQFMDQSGLFLQKHPDQILLWQLRAASAISLNDPMAGYEAGQKLLAAGVADSTDPSSRRLLAQLKNKGWLDREGAEKAKEHTRYILETIDISGESEGRDEYSERPFFEDVIKTIRPELTSMLNSRFPHVDVRTEPLDASPNPLLTLHIKLHYQNDLTYSKCKIGVWTLTCKVDAILTFSVNTATGLPVDHTSTLPIKVSGVHYSGNDWITPFYKQLRDSTVQSVLDKFKGILDEDALRMFVETSSPKT